MMVTIASLAGLSKIVALHFPASTFVSQHVYVQVSLNAHICQHC